MATARIAVRVGGDGFGPRRLLGVVAAASLVIAALLLGLPGRSLLWPAGVVALHRSSFSVPAEASPPYGPSSSPPASPAPSSPRATRACEARLAQYAGSDNPMNVSLVAAYDTTSEDVAADEERRRGDGRRSRWHDRPAGEFAAVCFFDADAFGVAGPPAPGAARPAFDRLEEIVRSDGVPVVYEAGHKTDLSARPIPSSGRQG